MTDAAWPVKGATVTIDEADRAGKIVSEIAVSGGETDENIVSAMNGDNFTFLGAQANYRIAFDMMVCEIDPFEFVHGAATVGGTKSSVILNNAGTTNDIEVDFGTNDDGEGLIYYFSGAKGVNAIPKFPFGGGNIVSLEFSIAPQDVTVEHDSSPA